MDTSGVNSISSPSVQKIIYIPEELTVEATITAAQTNNRPEMTRCKSFNMTVSILDSSSQASTPIKCIVALQSDNVSVNGHAICYISDTVSFKTKDQLLCEQHHNLTKNDYSIQRLGDRVHASGKGEFQLCLFEVSADRDYIIALDLHSVWDNEGIQCIAKAERCVKLIQTDITSERCKYPSLLRYESKEFNELMTTYSTPSFKGKISEPKRMLDDITLSNSKGIDEVLFLKALALTDKPPEMQNITPFEKECESFDGPSNILVQAFIRTNLSHSHSLLGEHEEALKCIEEAESICLNAAPSRLTCYIYFKHAHVLIRKHNSMGNNMHDSIKETIFNYFDLAIQHSYKDSMMKVETHLHKALFCLTGVCTMDHVPPKPQYKPTSGDRALAERHLNAAPMALIPDKHALNIVYLFLKSDLFRLNEHEELSLVWAERYAKKAKQLCCEIEKGHPSFTLVIEGRLQLLNELRLNCSKTMRLSLTIRHDHDRH